MNVGGCMFCKNAEGKKINQKMKKKINVALWKRGKIPNVKKNRKLKPPKYSSLYT
jgi:radical SAM superfamily enzyme